MSFISLRNKLAYPAGVQPGFDPTHVAAKGMSKGNGASGVAMGSGFVSVLWSSYTNTSVSKAIFGGVGPAITYPGAAITNSTGQLSSSTAALTCGAIIQVPASYSSGSYYSILSTVDSTGTLFVLHSGVSNAPTLLLYSNGMTSAFSLSVGTPYFVAASALIGGSTNFVAVNLNNGSVSTSTTASAGSNFPTGNGAIGNYNSNPFIGSISAIMWSPSYLSLSQLLQWASDPWSFWYPATKADPRTWLGWVGSSGAVLSNPRYVRLKQYARR